MLSTIFAGDAMVFGFFEGSIDILLPKTLFAFGEIIDGKLVLKLKNEKKGRQLKLTLLATREVTQTKTTFKKGVSSSYTDTDIETVFTADFIIDGEKSYLPPGAEYPFKIQLPASNVLPQAPQQVQGSGLMNTVMNATIAMAAANQRPVKWFLKGTLDVPGIDINKQVQISVQ